MSGFTVETSLVIISLTFMLHLGFSGLLRTFWVVGVSAGGLRGLKLACTAGVARLSVKKTEAGADPSFKTDQPRPVKSFISCR
jgi:hypothetical protein